MTSMNDEEDQQTGACQDGALEVVGAGTGTTEFERRLIASTANLKRGEEERPIAELFFELER